MLGHIGVLLAGEAAAAGLSISGFIASTGTRIGTRRKYDASQQRWLAKLETLGFAGETWKEASQQDLLLPAQAIFEEIVAASPTGGKSPIDIMSAAVRKLHEDANLDATNLFSHKQMRTQIKHLKKKVRKMVRVKHAPRATDVTYEMKNSY